MATYAKKHPRPAVMRAPPQIPAPEPQVLEAEAVEPVEAPVAEIVEAPAPFVEPAPEPAPPLAAALPEAPAVQAAIVAAVETPKPVTAEMRDTLRTLAEKGVAETRARLALAKSAASETAAAVEASYGAAHSGVSAFNLKAMEAAYESLNDTSSQSCNNTGLAASTLTAIKKAEAWVINYGRDSINRGHYYEVNSQSSDQETVYNPAGTLAVNIGSTALTGTGTHWLTAGYCDGAHFVGIQAARTIRVEHLWRSLQRAQRRQPHRIRYESPRALCIWATR